MFDSKIRLRLYDVNGWARAFSVFVSRFSRPRELWSIKNGFQNGCLRHFPGKRRGKGRLGLENARNGR